MSIGSLCKAFVTTIDEEVSLAEASKRMQENHVGSLVVVKTFDGKLIPCGIITDRDLALALGSTPAPQHLQVKQLMMAHPIVASASDGIFDTICKMRDHGVKRMPVVNDAGALIGIISADDLMSLLAQEFFNLAKISETQLKKERGVSLPVPPQLHA